MLTDGTKMCFRMHACMHAMLINNANGCILQLCTTLRLSISLDATHCQQCVHFLLLLLRFCLRLLPQSRHALQVLVLLVAFPQCHSVHVYTRDGGESHRTQETTKAVKRGSATHLSANDTLPRAADTNDASAAAGTWTQVALRRVTLRMSLYSDARNICAACFPAAASFSRWLCRRCKHTSTPVSCQSGHTMHGGTNVGSLVGARFAARRLDICCTNCASARVAN